MEHIQSTISQLKYGDIFKLGPNSWDSTLRLDSLHYYNDKLGCWQNEFSEDCRICYWLLCPYSNKGFKGVFKWSNTNKLDETIYIPKYLLSEHKKTYGKPCIPHGNNRQVFKYQLNDINISDQYCNHNKY